MMKHMRLRTFGILVAGIVFILDQLTKTAIILNTASLPAEVLPFFRITLVFNRGISFGMLSNAHNAWITALLPAYLVAITLLLIFWLFKATEKPVIMPLGLIIGGALGNLADRLRTGFVTDFLDFHIENYHWPAFNVADSCIFIGVVIFVFTNIMAGKTKPEGPATL